MHAWEIVVIIVLAILVFGSFLAFRLKARSPREEQGQTFND